MLRLFPLRRSFSLDLAPDDSNSNFLMHGNDDCDNGLNSIQTTAASIIGSHHHHHHLQLPVNSKSRDDDEQRNPIFIFGRFERHQ
ncbi:hypothetical protein BLOT_016287 [Blomia tropicalis]|nr:hypothetical protein BLOT_016287 [Blomia tropicalis]